MCFSVHKRGEYSNQMIAFMWFSNYFDGGIYCLENTPTSHTLCAKLAACFTLCTVALLRRRPVTEEKETGMRKRTEMKREISTLGMRANKRMWPVFLMTPLFKKKKNIKGTDLFASFGNSQSVVHFASHQNWNQSLWASKEFNLVNWCCVWQGSYTKLKLVVQCGVLVNTTFLLICSHVTQISFEFWQEVSHLIHFTN